MLIKSQKIDLQKLENLDNKMLPKYVIENQKKYSDWF